MKELKNKRLLVLGGSMWKSAIKDFADKYNVVIISAGLYPAGTDEIADEVYRIDTTDQFVMKDFIKDKNIDGVYMGGSEMIISAACKYINELGMPCYCTIDQWESLQDKSKFKELCHQFDLPCVRSYNLTDDNIKFPVITKPTDGCGSNGFSVSYNMTELLMGYNHAKQSSPSGSVLIEQFVKNDSVVCFYTICDGKVYFSGLEDKYPVHYKTTGSYVAGMHLFESKHVDDFRNRFDKKLEALFEHLGIKEGSVWIEVFHENDDYYFNEVGYRYSGSVSVYPVNYLYQINQVYTDIYYALTGESKLFKDKDLIDKKVPEKKYYCVYNVHMQPGQIFDITGLDTLKSKPEIVYIADTKKVGDNVKSSGTVAQVFAFVHFVFDNIEELKAMIGYIYDNLHVKDHNNNELIIDMLKFNQTKL